MPIIANLPLKQPMPVNTKAVFFFVQSSCKKQVSNNFSGKISPTITTYRQYILETLFPSSNQYQNYM